MVRIDAAQAMASMAWAGASGGAYGRRRGSPAGRFAAWWAAAQVAGLDWPVDPAELGEALAEIEWHAWEPDALDGGWRCHLAAHDPVEGLSWAVAAHDSYREGDDPLSEDSATP